MIVLERLSTFHVETALIVLSVLAIIFSAFALTLSFRLRGKVARMSSALRHNPVSTDWTPATLIRWLEQNERLPHALNRKDQDMLFEILRTVLLKGRSEADPILQQPAPPVATTAAPVVPVRSSDVATQNIPSVEKRETIQPEATRSVESPAASEEPKQTLRVEAPPSRAETEDRADQIAAADPTSSSDQYETASARLKVRGLKGVDSLRSKFEFNQFVNENEAVFFMFDDMENLVTSARRIPQAKQWFFTIPDTQDGLLGLFPGPAISQNAELLARNGHDYVELFRPYFDINLTGNQPELIEPALVRRNGDGLSVTRKGRMSL